MYEDLKIMFNRPPLMGTELDYVHQAVEAGHVSGDGMFTRRCRELLERELGVARALLTTSCTHALEMCALLLEVGPGDEVVIPTFTFVSTANAFVLRGARPVFVDIDPETLNLDPAEVARHVTPRTRAIVPVHYGGVACDMDAILALAAEREIPVVEDNAHGLFGKYRGRYLGTLGALATQSFHETKNFSCGEGGALLVNDPRFVDRAEILRDKGTNRRAFNRGLVDKYTWVDVGSSYPPSDILAAFLYAQLEVREQILARRRAVWERYRDELLDWAAAGGVRLPIVPAQCEQSYHLFYLLLPTGARRDAFIDHLRARGILAVFHYPPLHLSAMGRQFGGREGDCPVAERASQQLVRLPFYYALTSEDQTTVIEAILSFRP